LLKNNSSSYSDESNKYKFLKRQEICSNSRFDVFFDHVISPDKLNIEDFLIVKPKISTIDQIVGVCIIPMFNDKFYLMRGWRHQFNKDIYQAPAGFIESGESPEDTALRELEEETSLSCSKSNLIKLGSYLPDAGLIEGKVALFLAKSCIKSQKNKQLEIGSSKVYSFTKSDLINLLFNESLIGGSTLVSCYRALFYLDNLLKNH